MAAYMAYLGGRGLPSQAWLGLGHTHLWEPCLADKAELQFGFKSAENPLHKLPALAS